MKLLLLAQQAVENPTWTALRDSMRKEGDYARPSHMGSLWLIILGGALLAVIVETVRRLGPLRGRVLSAPPRRLFQHAARSVGISRLDRFLLLRAAGAGRLEHPTVMLITPELFETHAGEWADQFPIKTIRRYLRGRVNLVKSSLFTVSSA